MSISSVPNNEAKSLSGVSDVPPPAPCPFGVFESPPSSVERRSARSSSLAMAEMNWLLIYTSLSPVALPLQFG